MNSNAYQILSDLYRILGEADADSLKVAEKLAGTAELRSVIRALREATSSMPETAAAATLSASTDDKAKTSQQLLMQGGESSLAALLENLNLSNARIVKVLQQSGFQIKFKNKESRKRLVGRAIQKFEKLPRSKQQRTLSKLRQEAGIDETTGWFGVIKNRK